MEDDMMIEESTFYVNSEAAGIRIDQYLCKMFPEKTRSSLQKLLETEMVLLNGKAVAKNYKLKPDDEIKIFIPPLEQLSVEPENIPIDIVYEDHDVIVVNKPKGMVVHPAPGNMTGTLVNALLFHCKESLSGINGVIRPGIVHRIDKDTSGLLIVAKNDHAHVSLAEQIKEHSFDRYYEAVVYGVLKQDHGTINAPIGRSQKDRKKMAVTSIHSKNAVTHYEVLERFEHFTYVRLRLETGRTHQIRVHMSSIGFPLAGDAVYGPKRVISELKGQCLHAKVIGFTHPSTGKRMIFESELPDYFQNFLSKLRY